MAFDTRSHHDANQVFVLGTGRSGTTTMAHTINVIPGCTIRHEAEPPLLWETTAYLRGEMSHADMVDLLRQTRSSATLGGQILSGESNQRLSFLMPALRDAFPEARYLWIVRDGRDVVASTVFRGWYSKRDASYAKHIPDGWQAHRIQGDLVGDLSPQQWRRMDGFAKCCWYWAYTNRLIGQQIERLQLPSMMVRLEELAERLPDVLEFLQIDSPLDLHVPRANKARARLFFPKKPVRSVDWLEREWRVFTEIAGQEMDQFYPGWRDRPPFGAFHRVRVTSRRAIRATYTRTYETVSWATRPIRCRRRLLSVDGKGP